MLIGINLPDKYVEQWLKLSKDLGIADFDGFITYALGLGVQTLDAANKVQNRNVDNVISFNPDYHLDKK